VSTTARATKVEAQAWCSDAANVYAWLSAENAEAETFETVKAYIEAGRVGNSAGNTPQQYLFRTTSGGTTETETLTVHADTNY